MKKKLLKRLSALVFALAMVFSTGVAISVAKAENRPEIVLAEDEETPKTDTEEPKDDETTPEEDSSQETPAEPSESSSEEAKPQNTPSVEAKDIFKMIAKAFRDALKDLLAHFKKWFKL